MILGNDFYWRWLDKSMTYSSALFNSDKESLEKTQENKYSNIYKNINPKPDDHLLEIGCGWEDLWSMQLKYRLMLLVLLYQRPSMILPRKDCLKQT